MRVLMEEMSWKEIKDALESGCNSVIIPIGSIEQHGPHLPIFTDTLLGYELGKRIAEKLGNILVAPAIRPGRSDHHMGFPGTISLKSETLRSLISDYVESLAKHGFGNIVLLPTHGGNFGLVDEITPQLSEKFGVNIIKYTEFKKFDDILSAPARELGVEEERLGSHASAGETAYVLAARGDLVNMALAEPGFIGDLSKARERMHKYGIHSVTEIGILGDPTRATPEMGRRILDDLASEIARYIKRRLI